MRGKPSVLPPRGKKDPVASSYKYTLSAISTAGPQLIATKKASKNQDAYIGELLSPPSSWFASTAVLVFEKGRSETPSRRST
jgi:hypothetical protein